MTTTDNNALSQAIAQANNIVEMVGALNVDYERLEELRSQRQDIIDSFDPAIDKSLEASLKSFDEDEGEELAALEEAANGNEDHESAFQAIQEDPLSVQVREDWKYPGDTDSSPSEFNILLCTGGPAVRIMGELDEHMQPVRAWIEYQDWGTPWTHAVGVIEQDILLTYCNQFYFGE